MATAILDTGKCDVNIQSGRGFSPLMVASWKGDVELCELLLVKYDCKRYLKDNGGRNACGPRR